MELLQSQASAGGVEIFVQNLNYTVIQKQDEKSLKLQYVKLKTFKVDWHGKLIDEESWLTGKLIDMESWLTGKFIDKESLLTRKVDWQGKLIDKESWFTRKGDLQVKLIDEESQLMSKLNWQGKLID